MTTSGLRIGTATLAAGLLLLLAGCGQTAADRAAVINGSTSPLPGVTASPAASSEGAPTASPVPPDASGSPKDFPAGIADYCTRVYADQLKADQEHPLDEPAFEYQVAQAWAVDQTRLEALRAPASELHTFEQFVASSRAILQLRQQSAANPVAPGDDDPSAEPFQAALAARRPFATALHASRCDGELPLDQRDAAVARLREVDLTTDPQKLCHDLVTPEFVETQRTDTSDSMAACVATAANARTHPEEHASDIRVDGVTGVDGMTATIAFREVGGCSCDVPLSARLYYLDGAWKVRSIN